MRLVFNPQKITRSNTKRTAKKIGKSAKKTGKDVKRSRAVKKSWLKRGRGKRGRKKDIAGEAKKGFAQHAAFSIGVNAIATGVDYKLQKDQLNRVGASDEEKKKATINTLKRGSGRAARGAVFWGSLGAGVHALGEKYR